MKLDDVNDLIMGCRIALPSRGGSNNESLEYLDYLTVLPCRRLPLNSCKSLLFHGGNTGSIPVGDAKLEFPDRHPF